MHCLFVRWTQYQGTWRFLISPHFSGVQKKSSAIWIVVGVVVASWQWLVLCGLHWRDGGNSANINLRNPVGDDANPTTTTTTVVTSRYSAATTRDCTCPLNPSTSPKRLLWKKVMSIRPSYRMRVPKVKHTLDTLPAVLACRSSEPRLLN